MSGATVPDERVGASRLGRLARRTTHPAPAPGERCELCAEPLAPEHRHLLDLGEHRLLCACRACALLFDRRETGGRRYRLVPDRARSVEDFALSDALWDRLRIPVDIAFFFHSSAARRTVAFYPGAAGATESLLELPAWEELAMSNPVLAELEPDVEALLVNRTHGAREHWIVPVDECYRLVGIIRSRWRGLSGGQEVWEEIGTFFDGLRRRATRVRRDGHELAAPVTSPQEREDP